MIPTLQGNYINPRFIVKMVWSQPTDYWLVTLTDRSQTALADAVVRELLGKKYIEPRKDKDAA